MLLVDAARTLPNAAGGPTPKDAVIAMMGGSVALTGLVLVFLGLLYPASQAALWGYTRKRQAAQKYAESIGEPKDTADQDATVVALREIFYRLGKAIDVGTFALLAGLASIGLALAWLVIPGSDTVYVVSIWVFVLELVLIAAVVVLSLPPLSDLGVWTGEPESS